MPRSLPKSKFGFCIVGAGALIACLSVTTVSLEAQVLAPANENESHVPKLDLPLGLQHRSVAGDKITYHGGPLMPGAVQLYYIWYGTWDGGSKAILTNFAHAIGGSPYFDIATSYFDNSRTAAAGPVSYGGSVTDSYSLGKSLSDADVEAVVSNALKNGSLPTDSNGVYFVLTSPDVTETSGFTSAYCAWHTWGNLNGSNIVYAFVGDASMRKPQACSAQTLVSPNSNPAADAIVSLVAHELNASVSDPYFSGWQDSQGDESADKCAWNFGSVYRLSNGSAANVNLGGHDFLIEQNWVNQSEGSGSCVMFHEAASAVAPLFAAQAVAVPAPALAGGALIGSLIGSANGGTAAANLTMEGNIDWMHWGDGVASRKAGVTAKLGGYTVVGGGGTLKYSADLRPLSWTDGTPTASTTNDLAGVYVDADRGFSLTAPADTTIRTLTLHAGGLNSGGTLTAHLSDGSAADYMDVTSTASGQYDRNYTLTYTAASAGQILTVTWKMASGSGNVRLSGAALAGPAPHLPSITATGGTPQSAVIGAAFANSLQATVNINNAPLSGAAVTFSAPGGGASGTFNGSATVTTDSNGVATAPAFAANLIAGNYSVVASTPGTAVTAGFNLTNDAGPATSIAATGGTPQNTTINYAFAIPLEATVTDSNGNPVSGVPVTFETPGSAATAAFGGAPSAIATTGGNGVATSPVLTANGTVGNYIVTASASGPLGEASFALANTPVTVGGGIALVQLADDNSGIVVSSVTAKFKAGNSAGNWIGVTIYGGQGTAHTFTVTDSNGNIYRHALTQGNSIGNATMGIYYAENIKGGMNTVKVQPDHPGYLRVVVLEYSGVATTGSLDVTASAENTGLPNSGTASTTANGDLLLGVEITGDANSVTVGPGYKIEDQVPALPGTKLSVEDQIQAAAGPASASITSQNNYGWAMGLAAFKRAP